MIENDKMCIPKPNDIRIKNYVAIVLSYNAKLGQTDDPISATLLAIRMMSCIERLGSRIYNTFNQQKILKIMKVHVHSGTPIIDKYYVLKNLDPIAEELFNKIRGRSCVTIGDAEGKHQFPTKQDFLILILKRLKNWKSKRKFK